VDLLVIAQVAAIVIGALGGSAGFVMAFTLRQTKRKMLAEAGKTTAEGEKTEAEAVEILGRAAAGMLSPMEATIASLARQLSAANVEIEHLTSELRRANKRVGELEDSIDSLTKRVDSTAQPE